MVPYRRVDGALSGVEAPWLLHSVSATDCPLRAGLAYRIVSTEHRARQAAAMGGSSLTGVRRRGTRLRARLSWWISGCARSKCRFDFPVAAFELGMILTRQCHDARLQGIPPTDRWVAVPILENWLGYPVAAGELSSDDPAVGEERQ
jgi:hypothetical protein